MNVFGTKENEKAGNILFVGTEEECREYVSDHINDDNWYELNICDDNGVITERYIDAAPFRKSKSR